MIERRTRTGRLEFTPPLTVNQGPRSQEHEGQDGHHEEWSACCVTTKQLTMSPSAASGTGLPNWVLKVARPCRR